MPPDIGAGAPALVPTTFRDLAWLIPLIPALAFGVVMVFQRRLGRENSAWLATLSLLAATILAIGAFAETVQSAPQFDPHRVEVLHPYEYAYRAGEIGKQFEGQPDRLMRVAGARVEAEVVAEAAMSRPADGSFPYLADWSWLNVSGGEVLFGIRIDQLGAAMALMVAFVAFMIHLFSIGYMRGDDRYETFFAYLALFSAAMLGMVLAKNLLHVLIFWEIMGLMSYLLIGFHYRKPSAQAAQKKAFLTTRVGDLAFMLGVFWIWREFGTLDLVQIDLLAPTLGVATATGIGLLILLGAMGKSAQFPLHVWLPDAMEGPTPVSAMIHAATMVAAGVYLVARTYDIFLASDALVYVAWVGGITAIFAATMAAVAADAKKVFAFSTISQLGYMFLGLGVFGWGAAMFHLLAHSFFKALLFLGSGSMIHGSGTQDIFKMDALRRYLPITFATVLVGALSLMGFPFFAGFWSKDEILHVAQAHAPVLWMVGLATAALTAFYTTRLIIFAFFRPRADSPWDAAPWNQGGDPNLNLSAEAVRLSLELDAHAHAGHEEAASDPHGHPSTAHAAGAEAQAATHEAEPAHQPHESGWEMLTALVLLAAGALAVGLAGSPLFGHWLQTFLYYGAGPEVIGLEAAMPGFVTGTLIVVGGIAAALLLYGGVGFEVRAPRFVTMVLQRRYFIDELYYKTVVRVSMLFAPAAHWFDRTIVDGIVHAFAYAGVFLAALASAIDNGIVDGIVNLFANVTGWIGDRLRRVQTGQLQTYAWMIAAAAVILIVANVALGRN
jgi:NADH-quinone oxidoreductase subunit L